MFVTTLDVNVFTKTRCIFPPSLNSKRSTRKKFKLLITFFTSLKRGNSIYEPSNWNVSEGKLSKPSTKDAGELDLSGITLD